MTVRMIVIFRPSSSSGKVLLIRPRNELSSSAGVLAEVGVEDLVVLADWP